MNFRHRLPLTLFKRRSFFVSTPDLAIRFSALTSKYYSTETVLQPFQGRVFNLLSTRLKGLPWHPAFIPTVVRRARRDPILPKLAARDIHLSGPWLTVTICFPHPLLSHRQYPPYYYACRFDGTYLSSFSLQASYPQRQGRSHLNRDARSLVGSPS